MPVKEKVPVGMCFQHCCRNRWAQTAGQGSEYGISLYLMRNHGYNSFTLHYLPDTHRHCFLRHFINHTEPSLINLLHPADFVKLNNNIGITGFKVSRRIIKGNVTVHSNANKSQVDRFFPYLRCKVFDPVSYIPFDIDPMELFYGNKVYEPLIKVFPEARRMRYRQSDILVKVENLYLRPVDILFNERLKHLKLGTACRYDHPCFSGSAYDL